jgi:hypothetical protein
VVSGAVVSGAVVSGAVVSGAVVSGAVIWEHYITNPLDERVGHADGSVDEVRLTGTFNKTLDEKAREAVVREAFRVLRPGGRIVTHGLMADRALNDPRPKLPGLAAMVSHVPSRDEPIALVSRAGFVSIQITKLTPQPWFVHEGIGLREVKVVAYKPAPAAAAQTRRILYRGPFAEATVDGGHTFMRGRRAAVPLALWQQLRLGPSAEEFLFFDLDEPGVEGQRAGARSSPSKNSCS